ncbi:tRNA dihydrouridine(20/20a) synthase DusA [Deinococcus lacus]|uniref:tRNA-dihydrouridine(20/20a) synthase n=1 Tax=Deinococcus lacus TaxID=392561 RepID=A0ABW1YBM3_9DEIO
MTASLPAYTFSVAPMLDWTDRHCRVFHRALTRHALLYTEMVTVGAILHGDRARHLDFSALERPLALQLGGSDPAALAECASLAGEWGYSEVNLNCGCPSDRVQNGAFGACLMATPDRVAQAVQAMQAATHLPVTVKHRTGIDDLDTPEHLSRFVGTLADAGVQRITVHARKAWLSGLSPKENREIPPLDYGRVRALKAEFPGLSVILNGGLQNLAQAQQQLEWADGVMLGRAAYQMPYLLAAVDRDIFGAGSVPSRREVLTTFRPYVAEQLGRGEPLHRLLRHTLGLFAGERGARHYKRVISEQAHRPGAGLEVLDLALSGVPDEVLDARA